MSKKPIVIFCPSPFSLITNTVCEELVRDGYHIDSIVVRKFSLARFLEEFSRDGKRLLKKIWKKLVLREKAYSNESENIVQYRKKKNLSITNIKEFKKSGIKIITCKSLNADVVENHLKKLPEKLVVFTGGGIIRPNILKVAGDGIINCHMGILPKYKGMDLPEWALLEGNKDQIGLTLHFMDEGIDTGDILRKVNIPIKEKESVKELRMRFEPIMVSSIVNVTKDYLSNKIELTKQEPGQPKQYFIVHEKLLDILNKKRQKLAV